METTNRARDPGLHIFQLYDEIWVDCPRCGRAGRIVPHSGRVTCGSCGYAGAGRAARQGAKGMVLHARWTPRCGRCGGALPRTVTAAPRFHSGRATAPVRCAACGHVADYPVWIVPPSRSEGQDPILGLPLFLRTSVCGKTLWALNPRHLELLAAWVGAGLRERPTEVTGLTMMARLPRWMTARTNREAVLDGLSRLRTAAEAAK